MPVNHRSIPTAKKIALFKSFFSGLEHVYGIRDPQSGRPLQVKRPVTDGVIFDHLKGRCHLGVYLLTGKTTKAIVADMDTQNRIPAFEYVQAARHYNLPAYIEVSKSKGFHVWIFFESSGVKSSKARRVARHILEEIDCAQVEVFPKQDRLGARVVYGNFIFAPLFGQLVPRGKTVFAEPSTFEPFRDQWDFLQSIKRVPESILDDVIEINELDSAKPTSSNIHKVSSPPTCGYGLPPCAQAMLQKGVIQYQRVSCFRLAVHLKRVGLPYDLAEILLLNWARKNQPQGDKEVITIQEIRKQTAYAYRKHYSGYGCESEAVLPFCQQGCPLYSRVHQALSDRRFRNNHLSLN